MTTEEYRKHLITYLKKPNGTTHTLTSVDAAKENKAVIVCATKSEAKTKARLGVETTYIGDSKIRGMEGKVLLWDKEAIIKLAMEREN